MVPSGFLALVEDGRGNYLFYGEGVHLITDPFFKVEKTFKRLCSSVLLHGDRALVTVEQGKTSILPHLQVCWITYSV